MRFNRDALLNEANDECLGRKKKEWDATVRIDAEIKAALNELDGEEARRAAFVRLLTCVRSRTRLLKPTPGQGSVGWVAPVFLIHRLKNVAARQALWLRPCETWRAERGHLRPVF